MPKTELKIHGVDLYMRCSYIVTIYIFVCPSLHRFCVGDHFYLVDGKILCEYDYEERRIFATVQYNHSTLNQIKRQAQKLDDDLSSGYGSPSPNSLEKTHTAAV